MPTAEPELFERDSDLAELTEALLLAVGGHASVVAIEGPAGIGKTRLLRELRRTAEEADMRVLSARGGELERDFAFGVVRQLFEPLLARHRSELLSGAAALAAPLFDAGALPAEGGQQAFVLMHGLFWLAANVAAERPLLVVVDDLHSCDGESLRWLTYFERRVEGLPVLVALASRPTESLDAAQLLLSTAV